MKTEGYYSFKGPLPVEVFKIEMTPERIKREKAFSKKILKGLIRILTK